LGPPLFADLRLSNPLPEKFTGVGAAGVLIVVPSGRAGENVKGVLGTPETGMPKKDAVLPDATGLGGTVADGVSLSLFRVVRK
jgi:hypothetical protein